MAPDLGFPGISPGAEVKTGGEPALQGIGNLPEIFAMNGKQMLSTTIERVL
jgi:hypothetical protein